MGSLVGGSTSSSLQDWDVQKILKGASLLAAGGACLWLGSELWDRAVNHYAWSTWIRSHLRYRPGSTTGYLSKVLKNHSGKAKARWEGEGRSGPPPARASNAPDLSLTHSLACLHFAHLPQTIFLSLVALTD